MKNQAFTLIELLVVVLIIGILAAIAVPQYQKAVLSSRLTQYLVYMNALRKGADLYYTQHGVGPTDVRDLDIDIASNAVEFKDSNISSGITGAFFKDDLECMVNEVAIACLGKDFYLGSVHSWIPNAHDIVCYGVKNKNAEEICKSKSDGVSVGYHSGVKSEGYIIQ